MSMESCLRLPRVFTISANSSLISTGGVLTRRGERIPLRPKPYKILACLLANSGKAVSKADLLREVWEESFVDEGTLVQHVVALRKALGDQCGCLATVPSHGYRIEVPVRLEIPGTPSTKPPSPSHYAEMLEILYAAPLDQAKWQQFLERLCEITSSITALFVNNDSAQGIRRLATGGLKTTAETKAIYDSSFRYTDPIRQAYLRNPRTGFIEGEDLIAHEDLIKTEAFKAVGIPNGREYFSLIVITVSPSRHEMISLWRGAGRPILEPEYRLLIESLLPHMQNVLDIRRALGLMEDRARTAEAMLDASITASILLDEAGRIIYMNEAAQRLALNADGFTVDDNRPIPTDPSRRSEFENLVAACASADSNSAGGALTLARGMRKRPLQVVVTPLRLSDPHRSGVRTLVMATDPDRVVIFPDAILRQLYGLTPAETEIANGLLTGFSIEEVAKVRGVSLPTVRSQMSSLLGKTGSQSHNELIRLLTMLPHAVPQVTSGVHENAVDVAGR